MVQLKETELRQTRMSYYKPGGSSLRLCQELSASSHPSDLHLLMQINNLNLHHTEYNKTESHSNANASPHSLFTQCTEQVEHFCISRPHMRGRNLQKDTPL